MYYICLWGNVWSGLTRSSMVDICGTQFDRLHIEMGMKILHKKGMPSYFSNSLSIPQAGISGGTASASGKTEDAFGTEAFESWSFVRWCGDFTFNRISSMQPAG